MQPLPGLKFVHPQKHPRTLTALNSPQLSTYKGYQCRDNSICWPHCKRPSEDPQEISHGLEECCSIKCIWILLGTVNGYRTEKRREWRLVSDSHLMTQPPDIRIEHPFLGRAKTPTLGASWKSSGETDEDKERWIRWKGFPFLTAQSHGIHILLPVSKHFYIGGVVKNIVSEQTRH